MAEVLFYTNSFLIGRQQRTCPVAGIQSVRISSAVVSFFFVLLNRRSRSISSLIDYLIGVCFSSTLRSPLMIDLMIMPN